MSLLRFLLTARTGTTISRRVAPPWTNREPPPARRETVDRLRDLYLQIAVEPELHGVECAERDIHLQAAPEDVATVGYLDVVTAVASADRKNESASAPSWNKNPWSAVTKMLVALALASFSQGRRCNALCPRRTQRLVAQCPACLRVASMRCGRRIGPDWPCRVPGVRLRSAPWKSSA